MNYIGSKLSLLVFLEESINQTIDGDERVFCDFFAGTGAVGIHFKKRDWQIIANDIQYYSYILNRHYIGNHKPLRFLKLSKEISDLRDAPIPERMALVCRHLSSLEGKKGFIYKNYCLGGTKNTPEPRQYFSDENGMKCDAIRQTLEAWRKKRAISDDEYYFLLASLLESIDKRANTASVYGAFLKKLKKSARSLFALKPAELILNNRSHKVFCEDINQLAGKTGGDVLYLDPPYNQRQYAANYHLLETIAKYDHPKVYGKTGLRSYQSQKSLYCSRVKAKQAFRDLILRARAKYIFLSYNNEGLMSLRDIEEIMSLRGKYGYRTKTYNRFKADREENRNYKAGETVEYLHYAICRRAAAP